MKNKYVKPLASVEEFAANDFVAVCQSWNLACSVNGTDIIPQYIGTTQANAHRSTQCGDRTHQQITIREDNTFFVTEIGTDQGKGDLACTLYTDGTYTQQMPSNTDYYKLANKTLYWTTTYKVTINNREYGPFTAHHRGIASVTGSGTSNNHS